LRLYQLNRSDLTLISPFAIFRGTKRSHLLFRILLPTTALLSVMSLVAFVQATKNGVGSSFGSSGTLGPGNPLQTGSSSTGNVTVKAKLTDGVTSVNNFASALYKDDGVTKLDSIVASNDELQFLNVPLGVHELKSDALPKDYKIEQNYPNPFNPSTKIRMQLPKSGSASLKVYNILGQEISSFSGELQAGTHEQEFILRSLFQAITTAQ